LREGQAADAVGPRRFRPQRDARPQRFDRFAEPAQAQVTAAQLKMQPVMVGVNAQALPILLGGLFQPVWVGLPFSPFPLSFGGMGRRRAVLLA
jgi:hypothetical protein